VGAGQDHLERHGALEADLPGLVDDAHASSTQLFEDLVAGDAPFVSCQVLEPDNRGRRGWRWRKGLGLQSVVLGRFALHR
jgi:hypothetical protein